MPHEQAANIVAVRNAIEDIMVKTANNPEIIADPTHEIGRTCQIIRSLCRSNSGRYTSNAARGIPRRCVPV